MDDAALEGLESRKGQVERCIGPVMDPRTFKGVVVRILDLIRDPHSSVKDLAQVATLDPALATKILSVVNSPIYAMAKRVTDLTQAIALLGYEETQKVVLSVAVFDSFTPDSQLWMLRIFRHSIHTAKFAQVIAAALGRLPSEAFTCGLLADIGLVLLCQCNPRAFGTILYHYRYAKGSMTPLESEEKVLGITHQEIGAYAALSWKLPELVIESILGHHTPLVGGLATEGVFLAQLVHLADLLADILGVPYLELAKSYDPKRVLTYLSRPLMESLNVSHDHMAELLPKLGDAAREAEQFYALMEHKR